MCLEKLKKIETVISPKKSDSQHYKQRQLINMEVCSLSMFTSINFLFSLNKTWNAGQLISTTLTKGIKKSFVGHWIHEKPFAAHQAFIRSVVYLFIEKDSPWGLYRPTASSFGIYVRRNCLKQNSTTTFEVFFYESLGIRRVLISNELSQTLLIGKVYPSTVCSYDKETPRSSELWMSINL